jgi:hypothetical protein
MHSEALADGPPRPLLAAAYGWIAERIGTFMEQATRTWTRATLAASLAMALAGCGASVAPGSVAPGSAAASTARTTDVTPNPTVRTTQSSTATAPPSSTATATPGFVGFGPLPAGRYRVGTGGLVYGGVQFTFTIPDGWAGPPSTGFAVLKEGPTEQEGMILSFWWPSNVYADVCDNTSLLDPPIGPTVGDFASALADQTGTDVTDPTPITVDGFPGERVDLTVRTDVADCPGAMWLWQDKDGGGRSTDTDEDSELSILDVDGERVVIYVLYSPGTPEEERAELRTIFESIQIEP